MTLLRITPGPNHPLHNAAATRALEQTAHRHEALMPRAGLALARLCAARFPHCQRIWVACGPGNNGGDGLLAASHLHTMGKTVCVTWLGTPERSSPEASAAWEHARAAGLHPDAEPPGEWDVCIDALLGMGHPRPLQGLLRQWVRQMRLAQRPVLAADVPTGLNADTGDCADHAVQATVTLSLLTLKPGLFTAQGRDAAGEVWWDDLGVPHESAVPQRPPTTWLNPAPSPHAWPHASHKGSRGDVAVVGGAPGMEGAAWLAASAALHGGAGRVHLHPLSEHTSALRPDVMVRPLPPLGLERWSHQSVVCGCGGGSAVAAVLPAVLAQAPRLVLDADALNAVAHDANLRQQLAGRAAHSRSTVITPHPLEAARLLGCDTAHVQADRLHAAQALANALRCTVVLKGSGTLIAAPGEPLRINPTGNGRLATAGTGDVLAGLIGALLAQGRSAPHAAHEGVYRHGWLADTWPANRSLCASALADAL